MLTADAGSPEALPDALAWAEGVQDGEARATVQAAVADVPDGGEQLVAILVYVRYQ